LQTDCQDIVTSMSISNTAAEQRHSYWHPAGCSLVYGANHLKLVFNSENQSDKACDGNDDVCICSGERPIPTMSDTITAGTCPPLRATFADYCKQTVAQISVGYAATFKIIHKGTRPAGCFLQQQASGWRGFYNTNFASTEECSNTRQCLCLITAFQAEPPAPTFPGAYTTACKPCPTPISTLEDCEAKAAKLGLYFNQIITAHSGGDPMLPEGCSKIEYTLWWNPYKAGVNGVKAMCDKAYGQKTTCVCDGVKPLLAYQVMVGTCGTENPLAPCECETMANELGLEFTEFQSITSDARPARCFLETDNDRLVWNSDLTSTVPCGTNGTNCICARAP